MRTRLTGSPSAPGRRGSRGNTRVRDEPGTAIARPTRKGGSGDSKAQAGGASRCRGAQASWHGCGRRPQRGAGNRRSVLTLRFSWWLPHRASRCRRGTPRRTACPRRCRGCRRSTRPRCAGKSRQRLLPGARHTSRTTVPCSAPTRLGPARTPWVATPTGCALAHHRSRRPHGRRLWLGKAHRPPLCFGGAIPAEPRASPPRASRARCFTVARPAPCRSPCL